MSPNAFITSLLILLMELLAAFALLIASNFLSVTSLGYGTFLLLLGVGILGVLVSTVVRGFDVPQGWAKVALMTSAGVVTLFTASALVHTSSARLSLAALVALVYLRGVKISEDSLDYVDVQHSFSLGFALLLVSIIWMIARGLITQSPTWASLALVSALYTVVALITLATARLDEVRARGVGHTILFSVSMQVMFLLIVSLVAIELLSVDLAGALGRLLQPFWRVIGAILLGILQILVTPLIDLATYVHLHTKVGHTPPPRRFIFNSSRHHLAAAGHSGGLWLRILGISAVLLVSLGLLFFIWHTLPDLRKRQVRKRRKTRALLWSPRGFWPAFLSWARGLLRGSAGLVAQTANVARRRVLGPSYPSNPVRRTYAQLLSRASKQGVPRAAARTPAEFLGQLLNAWPAGSQHFIALTNAYILCRYGEASFQEQQLSEIKDHWRAVNDIMRQGPQQV